MAEKYGIKKKTVIEAVRARHRKVRRKFREERIVFNVSYMKC